jgi:hypothetical protein
MPAYSLLIVEWLHQRLPGFPSRNGFLTLVVRQFRLAAHVTTPRALARFSYFANGL